MPIFLLIKKTKMYKPNDNCNTCLITMTTIVQMSGLVSGNFFQLQSLLFYLSCSNKLNLAITNCSFNLSNSLSLCIQSKDFQTIEALYHNLIQHDEVHILTPFKKNSFSPGYAIIRDPFGIVIQLTVTRHDF